MPVIWTAVNRDWEKPVRGYMKRELYEMLVACESGRNFTSGKASILLEYVHKSDSISYTTALGAGTM